MLVPGRTVISDPSSKLPTQTCPAPLCFPTATDQTQPPLPKTQLSAQTQTFQLLSSRSPSSLGHLPFSNCLLQMPRGVSSHGGRSGTAWSQSTDPKNRRRPQPKGESPCAESRQAERQPAGASPAAEGAGTPPSPSRISGCQALQMASHRRAARPLSSQQCVRAESWPLPPAMLPSSHLPAPSNPLEGLQVLQVSSETSKAVPQGSAEGYRGGV